MKQVILFVTLVTLSYAGPAGAQQATKPIRYTWVANSCETWNCAAGALVEANGSPNVIVLPTGNDQRPWLILRRVEEGSVFVDENEPFGCEVFDGIPLAASTYSATNPCHGPMILSVPDGRLVIAIQLKCAETTAPKRRPSSH